MMRPSAGGQSSSNQMSSYDFDSSEFQTKKSRRSKKSKGSSIKQTSKISSMDESSFTYDSEAPPSKVVPNAVGGKQSITSDSSSSIIESSETSNV